MTPEERVTTLILHGCSMYQPLHSSALGDPRNRFVISSDNRLRLAYYNHGRQSFKWEHQPEAVSHMESLVEIPWETGLIAFVSETIFVQFIKSLTRQEN